MEDDAEVTTGTPAGRRGLPALAAVAVVAALVGGLVGAGVVALTRDDPAVAPAVPVLSPAFGDGDRVADIAAAVVPSVVRIDVRGIGTGGASGNASGVVVDDEGHVVTNNHVIAGATSIEVTFADRSRADAVLVGSDPRSDLAVIRVEGDTPPPVPFADGGSVRVGQLAVVVGSPFGLDGTVTAGIVSAIDRPVDLRGPDGEVVRLTGVLQTDAGISPGNSGGPLVGADGRLIGVTSAVLAEAFGGGVGFAIPVGTVRDVVAALIADGRVAQPYLGLAGTTLDPGVAAALDVAAGAVVDRVDPGGPASQAGIVPGDVITAVDGEPLAAMDDLVAAVRAAGVGATLALDVVRDGTARTVPVELADADAGPADERED